MFCYLLPVTRSANWQTKLPNPPGHCFLWLFQSSSKCSVYLARAISFFVFVALIYDLIDVPTGNFVLFYLKTEYGREEPVIMLMAYCHSQMALFMAASSLLFLLVKRADLTKCSEKLNLLAGRLEGTCVRLRPRLTRLRVCLWAVVGLGLVAILTTLVDPNFRDTFLKPRPYGFALTPGGALSLYFRR